MSPILELFEGKYEEFFSSLYLLTALALPMITLIVFRFFSQGKIFTFQLVIQVYFVG